MILKSDKVKVLIRRKFIPYVMREEKHTIKTDIDAKTKTVLENQIRRKVVPYHERRKTRNKN